MQAGRHNFNPLHAPAPSLDETLAAVLAYLVALATIGGGGNSAPAATRLRLTPSNWSEGPEFTVVITRLHPTAHRPAITTDLSLATVRFPTCNPVTNQNPWSST